VEFQDVVRRMVRNYDLDRPVPPEVVERILENALRAPSAGFSQGFGFLVLDNQDDIARFRAAATPDDEPENWFSATVQAPLLIVAHSNKDAYLDRYAQADKGHTDRSEDWWPVPIGYSDEPPRDLSKRRKPASDLIHRSRWTS
jgi:nitroreductase